MAVGTDRHYRVMEPKRAGEERRKELDCTRAGHRPWISYYLLDPSLSPSLSLSLFYETQLGKPPPPLANERFSRSVYTYNASAHVQRASKIERYTRGVSICSRRRALPTNYIVSEAAASVDGCAPTDFSFRNIPGKFVDYVDARTTF